MAAVSGCERSAHCTIQTQRIEHILDHAGYTGHTQPRELDHTRKRQISMKDLDHEVGIICILIYLYMICGVQGWCHIIGSSKVYCWRDYCVPPPDHPHECRCTCPILSLRPHPRPSCLQASMVYYGARVVTDYVIVATEPFRRYDWKALTLTIAQLQQWITLNHFDSSSTIPLLGQCNTFDHCLASSFQSLLHLNHR